MGDDRGNMDGGKRQRISGVNYPAKKFWAALAVFSLMGQVAWVVENMYFNIFIYKMFHASAADISLMVGASSVAATVTTILVGAYTDYVGRRKAFICGGYVFWGVSIMAFAFLRMDLLTPLAGGVAEAAALGVNLVILMDCIMTFLGSSANDACFNAWMTDWGNGSNRGKIEGINSMMPLVAILVVFGGFAAFDLDRPESWTSIYLIVGATVVFIGLLGIFLIEERTASAKAEPRKSKAYTENLCYSFRLSVVRANPLLYAVIGAFAVFGISINIFMPYLILYYEKTLGMENYVMIMAPAIVLAAVITAFYGRLYDLLGFKMSVLPTLAFLMAGYVILYLGKTTGIVFLGSLLMMTGYLTGMAVFGAMIRSRIPEERAGQFQGIRIIGQVLVPGIVGPALGAAVLRNAETIVNADGTTSFLPNRNIYMAAFGAAAVLLFVLGLIFRMMRRGHNQLVSESAELLFGSLQGEETVKGRCECSEDPKVWQDYPRPQMRRQGYMSLNGIWMLNGGKILVPFPPQSYLSGYKGSVGSRLEYQRTFPLTADNVGKRVLLHFGAVDQVAEVFVNGSFVGKHEGGYLPFSFDITVFVHEGENLLKVRAKDTLSARYPYGKQRKNRGGMWYTPVSGIWQSVWMECVPLVYIAGLKVDADTRKVRISVRCSDEGSCRREPGADGKPVPGACIHGSGKPGPIGGNEKPAAEPGAEGRPVPGACTGGINTGTRNGITVTVTLHDGSGYTVQAAGTEAEIDMSAIRLPDGTHYRPLLWDVADPWLYEMTVTMGEDTVRSYFGLRTIEVKKADGIPRVCLNGKPIFLQGVLDQGYFCDGIYLPAKEAEYEQDVLRMKALGMNLLRKHIKIEPESFYYYCDLHGMLVMQDMVNNGFYSWIRDTALPTLGFCRKKDEKSWYGRKRRDFFAQHMKDTILHLYNHPCIIAYTIFNEGWGQFESDAMYRQAKALDGTRLYDATSGWFSQNESDFDSQHIYFKKLVIPEKPEKPVLVSECGGYSLRVPGHFYSKHGGYGYGECRNRTELTMRVKKLYEKVILPAIPKGLCGCIYTQLSDVEDEINGFYTYDRKVCKVEPEVMREASGELEKAV